MNPKLRDMIDQTIANLRSRVFIPPVQSLMDVDVYKPIMGQFIKQNFPNIEVTFRLIVRDKSIQLWRYVDKDELRQALDYVRKLRMRKTDLYYLRGMDLYDKYMFKEPYLDFLKGLQLPEYSLEQSDGVLDLQFPGVWEQSSLWETIGMSILSELYYRGVMREMTDDQIRDMYVVADNRLQNKLLEIKKHSHIKIADFGTRRRHSFLWQRYVVGECKRVLGSQFTGTSNLWMAFHYDLDAKGTNAHELPMVATAIADGEAAMRYAQYDVLDKWEAMYGDALRILLPDTYGSEQFFRNAPAKLVLWTGERQDSGVPIDEINRYRAWVESHGVDQSTKLSLASDGLNVPSMIEIGGYFKQVGHPVGYGYGTGLMNDFAGTVPGLEVLRQFSMVIKPYTVNGRYCVKLSNDYSKATGPKSEVDRYVGIFGSAGRVTREVFN